MDLLKSLTGKIVAGAVALTVVAGGISWWRMDEATRQMLLGGTGRIVAWLGVVLVVPWVTFFVIARVAKMESNAAGATLVLAYTILEVALLGWLFGWAMPGPTAWTFFAVGGLFAAAYNLFACDWIAEKVS
jgi:hypothetical protein